MANTRRETSLDLREVIVKLNSEGKSLRDISKIVKRSHCTVYKIINKYKQTGSVQNKPRNGRPKKLSNREIKEIAKDVKKNPTSSAVKIAEKISQTNEKTVSASTVRRALHSCGLHGRVPRKKPNISEVNRKKRLEFAKLHQNKTIDFWNNILFTDESKFEIFGTMRKSKIWRTKNTELQSQNIIKTTKHGGGSVMVWGCMASAGVGDLVFIESTMDRYDYLNILKNHLPSSVSQLNLQMPWTFQQDRDPKHTARIVKEWLLYNVPKQLHSPPQSPDLNPIEHLWEELDRRIRKRNITNKDSLKTALLEEWRNIKEDTTRNLVFSMPRRLKAVIKAKGAVTKY